MMSSKDVKRVAVIGAGASGLPAIKWCVQYGFNVVCYEKQNDIAGLWRYKQTDNDGESCVMKSTVINTSKEMTAYSDFPPPADCANFMHNSQMLAYLRSYAEQFDLLRHIELGTAVVAVRRDGDSGGWNVSSRKGAQRAAVEHFDAVMVCTGHHAQPYMPTFTDEHLFSGRMLHAHTYKDHGGFEDLNVVVVGIGNSAGDIAVELSRIAKQVHLVARRGAWVMNRIFDYGVPADMAKRSRAALALVRLMPISWFQAAFEKKLNQRFDHAEYGLKPAHSPMATHPTVNDDLPNRIASGTIKIKPAIDRFTGPKSIKFVDGTEVHGVDAVVAATGYSYSFPFLEDGQLIPVEENRAQLYKFMYTPNIENVQSLAVIGFIQPLGSIVPMSEMQARVFCHYLSGAGTLPDKAAMLADIEGKRSAMAARYVQSRRHTMQVDYDVFMDELAEMIGCKPDPLRILATYRSWQLAKDVFFQPLVSYQYRLLGPHTWEGAPQAIRGINQRRLQPTLGARAGQLDVDKTGFDCRFFLYFGLITIFMYWLFFY